MKIEFLDRYQIIEFSDFYYCDGQPIYMNATMENDEIYNLTYLSLMGINQSGVFLLDDVYLYEPIDKLAFSIVEGNRTWDGLYFNKPLHPDPTPWKAIQNDVPSTALAPACFCGNNNEYAICQWELYNDTSGRSGIGQLWMFKRNGFRLEPWKPIIKHWQPEDKPDHVQGELRGIMGGDIIKVGDYWYLFYARDLQWEDYNERNTHPYGQYPSFNHLFEIESLQHTSVCVARTKGDAEDWKFTKWYNGQWSTPGVYPDQSIGGFDTTVLSGMPCYHHKLFKHGDDLYLLGQSHDKNGGGFFVLYKNNGSIVGEYAWGIQQVIRFPFVAYYPIIHGEYMYFCIDVNAKRKPELPMNYPMYKLARQKIQFTDWGKNE